MSRSGIAVSLFSFMIATIVVVTPQKSSAQAKFGDAEFKCVSGKQKAAGKYCKAVLKAWSKWETKQDDGKRDAAITKALTKLTGGWGKQVSQ